MKLTGPACTEAMSEAGEAKWRERAEGNAGGVRVERRVRPMNDLVSDSGALTPVNNIENALNEFLTRIQRF